MSSSASENRSSHPVAGLVVLPSILVVYLLLLWLINTTLPATWRSWVVLTAPNLWLGAASAVWVWIMKPKLVRFRGGRRALPGAIFTGLTATLLIVMVSTRFGVSGIHLDVAVPQQLILVLIVPFVEELYFRGILLDHLHGRVGSLFAILLVTLLFAFLHFPQGTALPMMVLSLVTCALTLVSGSVFWGVVAHVGWNALAVVYAIPDGSERWIVATTSVVVLVGLTLWGFKSRDVGPKR